MLGLKLLHVSKMSPRWHASPAVWQLANESSTLKSHMMNNVIGIYGYINKVYAPLIIPGSWNANEI